MKLTAAWAILLLGPVAGSVAGGSKPPAERPPYTDYCAMLSQEIQGRKHAFLAGNLVYYIGGRYNCWQDAEDETIGLTHPFYHDLRGRGFGLARHKGSGYGHDFRGWEFYNQTRVAYGAVVVGGKPYPYPIPVSMRWRPDKVLCDYKVGGVNIHEEKFIAGNDTACSIVSSDAPITLRLDGQSLVIPKLSIDRTSTVCFDRPNNAVPVTEGGTVVTHPVKEETCTGKLIYDGMSTVLSSSAQLAAYSAGADDEGRRVYSFEIPYFRCSDRDVTEVYYYLWAIYLMYYIDVQKGWERYPHTQTAVNNFLGMHRYDANFQIKVGAWEIYRHTGDVVFLHTCYDDYFKELFKNGMLGHWGCHYDAAECLRKMAILTGDREDPDRWRRIVRRDDRDRWLGNMWQAHQPNYFGGGDPLRSSGFAYLRNRYFPEDWARRMTCAWAVDSTRGFFWTVPLSTVAKKDWTRISRVFTSTPDTNYYAIIGMYNSRVGRDANVCALAHLKRYNRHWNIPIAPWLEEDTVLSAPEGYATANQSRNHIGYVFQAAPTASVTIAIIVTRPRLTTQDGR